MINKILKYPWYFFFAIMLLAIGIAACQPAKDKDDDDSTPTVKKENSTAVKQKTLAAGEGDCKNGGVEIAIGIDDNGDGKLDEPAEVDNREILCHLGGINSMVSITAEPGGTNCSAGGQKIQSGMDMDGNGKLEGSELGTPIYACNGVAGTNGANGKDAVAISKSPKFVVRDTATISVGGTPLEGATVYAIPAADVINLGKVALASSDGNYTADALAADEPLEDLVNTKGSTYMSAVTDVNGKVEITALAGKTEKYFIYVKPADETKHLPGGSICRESVTGDTLTNQETAITISTTPSTAATFVGSSKCIACHDTYSTETSTMHKLGIRIPGVDSGLQDLASFRYKDEYDKAFTTKFTAGDITSGGTTIYYSDYDSARKFDKFKTSETEPTSGTLWGTLRLYKDSTSGKYMMQVTNKINASDTKSPLNLEVVMNYGGGLYKQRYLTKLDGKKSMYILPVQFNVNGDDTSSDRVRKVWRDYHLDWWITVNDAKDSMTLKTAPAASKSFDAQCASCHYNGYSLTESDGEYVATGVLDNEGEVHPVTGIKQEMNIGCETCHGPGSEHISAGGKGEFIVSPSNLTPERAVTLCVQCHTRPQGNPGISAIKGDSPLNQNNQMMRAGISRAAFLAGNTSRHDAATSDYWGDGTHSKSHHQQATDFLKSVKYRNGDKLLTCASCHDPHAAGTDRHQLSGTSDGSLCQTCHAEKAEVMNHSLSLFMGNNVTCVDCHNTKTANSGAGLNATSSFVGDSGTKYFRGDITSHLFDVPRKATASSTNTMPVPYISGCAGACHSGSNL
ncbi:cytochrome c3 family protein [Deltaproteobacteria bacterium TL4]